MLISVASKFGSTMIYGYPNESCLLISFLTASIKSVRYERADLSGVINATVQQWAAESGAATHSGPMQDQRWTRGEEGGG